MIKFQLFVLILLAGCGDPFSGSVIPQPEITSAQSPLTELKTNFEARCINCHAWVSDESEILKRVVPGNPDNSSIYQRLRTGNMPLGGPRYSAAELESIRFYISSLTAPPAPIPDPPVPPPVPIPDPPAPVPTEVSFAELKQSIFAPKCVTCHKAMDNESTIPARWLVAGDPQQSKLYQVIENGRMPKIYPAVTSNELEMVRDYIHDIGGENPKVSFDDLYDNLLGVKCVKCHSGMQDEQNVLRMIAPRNPEGSKLYEVMANGSMPKRLAPVSDADLKLLYQYIEHLKKPVTSI